MKANQKIRTNFLCMTKKSCECCGYPITYEATAQHLLLPVRDDGYLDFYHYCDKCLEYTFMRSEKLPGFDEIVNQLNNRVRGWNEGQKLSDAVHNPMGRAYNSFNTQNQ